MMLMWLRMILGPSIQVEEEMDVGLEEDFVALIEGNMYVGTQVQFLLDYNDTVNRSVEEYL